MKLAMKAKTEVFAKTLEACITNKDRSLLKKAEIGIVIQP